MKNVFKMNEKVFRALAYITTTPQKKLTHEPVRFVFCENNFLIMHGEVGGFGKYSLTDLRAISRLLEELTDKVVLVDINSLVWNGFVEVPQELVMSNYWEDSFDGTPLESHHVFLHQFKRLKIETRPRPRQAVRGCAEEGV